jgi:fatty-acyl-CoA synthase
VRAPFGRTLMDVVAEVAQAAPSAPAVISGGTTVSYGALHARARQVAAAFRDRGIGHGDRVGLLISNRLEWVELCLGASGAGATVVPFSTWSTRQELDFLIGDSGIAHLVALARFGDRDYAADLAALLPGSGGVRPCRFPALRGVTLIGGSGAEDFGAYDSDFDTREGLDLAPGEAAGAGDDGLVLYTSGSSANPKAVRLKQFGIVENGFNIGERMGLGPEDRVLLSAPLFWSYGSANCLPAVLTHGAALVLQEKFGAAESIALIERHGCTALYTLPGMTKAILSDPSFRRERVQSLRTGLTIGAPQDFLAAVEGLGAQELCNIYGATETYGNCCVTWHHWPVARRALCQGTPLPGNVVRFVDPETGQPVAPGEPGLTEVRGYVTPGYSGASADQNALAFTPDGYYRTGDVGRLDEDGAFVFVGRNTEMIKRAGINVSPAEVENILLLHPRVALAGVVGVPDADRGEVIVAFVVPEAGKTVSAEELIAHCRATASKYKLPDRIEVRASLPQTPTGKLQRRELKGVAAALMGGAHG